MRYGGTLLMILAVMGFANTGGAQQAPLFNGVGINLNESDSDKGRTRFFDFSSLANRPEAKPKRGLQMPKWEWPKWQPPKLNMPNPFSEPDRALPASNAADSSFKLPTWNEMFPPRDPDEPNFLERLGERNREFWGRTRDNFSNWGQRDRGTSESNGMSPWDRLTRPFQAGRGASAPPARPPLRSMQQRVGGNTVKY